MRIIINIIVFIAVSIAIFAAFMSRTHAAEGIKIIGCINTYTLITTKPNNNGNCLNGKGWQNIMLPPDSHINKWKKVFGTDRAIINRLAIVNGESGFNEHAGNKWAKGYVQTLRSYNIKPDILSQLTWMRDRQEAQKKGNCSQWKGNEERTIRCLYARHYGALDGYHWYPTKNMKVRAFYIEYFKTNKI